MIRLFYIKKITVKDFDLQNDRLVSRFGNRLKLHIAAKRNIHHQMLSCLAYAMLAEACLPKGDNHLLEVDFDKYGKPFLLSINPCSFSISHSKDYVVLALSDKLVGVDIEWMGDREYISLAERFFAKEEMLFLNTLPYQEQKETFYQLWTLKESYVKALGLGLRISLSSFAFTKQRAYEWALLKNAEEDITKNAWAFKVISLLPNYSIAIATALDEAVEIKESSILES